MLEFLVIAGGFLAIGAWMLREELISRAEAEWMAEIDAAGQRLFGHDWHL